VFTQTHGILKIFFSLCRKPTNYICGNGDTRDSENRIYTLHIWYNGQAA